MHRKIQVASLLYQYLYPKPSSNDPPNFSGHLARNLIPEIRIETSRFYGALDTIEARYPGLNYTHGPHIRRLSAFPHHARLFKAIAHLRITDAEVLDLARWEGTLWARQRFEKDEGYKVKDTTGDDIGEWVDPRKVKKSVSVIGATKTTTFTTVTGVRELPAPLTAISCELEVQEPEPEGIDIHAELPVLDERALVATPRPIDTSPDDGAVLAQDEYSGRRDSATPRPVDRSMTPQEMLENLSSTLSPQLRDQLGELFSQLGQVNGRGIELFRDEIFRRLSSSDPAELPSAINLVGYMELYMEQYMQQNTNAADTAQPPAARQVITQPAA